MAEIQQSTENGIVGRGNRDGARLFREWFDELNSVADVELLLGCPVLNHLNLVPNCAAIQRIAEPL